MKYLNKQWITFVLSSIFLLPLTAVSADEDAEVDIDFRGSDCIWVRSIRDYTILDGRTLLIDAGGKRPYLVQLFRPSFEMKSSHTMRVHSRDDRLCPHGGDGLIFSSFDDQPDIVKSISRITEEQADRLLVRYGKKEGSEPQAPAPRKVEGAEVEELD